LKFRVYKKDNKGGYVIQGLAFSDDEEDYSVGIVLERVNYPSGKSPVFDLGTEANKLGRMVFDLLNDVFKKYGELLEIRKVEGWFPRIGSATFKVSLQASWRVEENKWNNLTQEIEKHFKGVK